jgi:putative hydrolase of the HAD superfamily
MSKDHGLEIHLDYILFDLDNTLYPESSGIQTEIHRRMTIQVAKHLGVSLEKAEELKKYGYKTHGTTLRWLQVDHGLSEQNIQWFLDEVHPSNPEQFLTPDPKLDLMLGSLPLPLAVLTNSPMSHAQRILTTLGINLRFTHVFDLTFNELEGKPHANAYRRCLEVLGTTPERVLFIDDVPGYLDGFKRLGGKTLLIDEFGIHQATDHPNISQIHDLPSFLYKNYL